MISDLWTIEPAGAPEEAVTLSSLGVSSATLSRQSQTPATLSLSIPGAEALTADWSDYTWESQWVIRRDEAVFFRGRIDQVPRAGAGGSESIELTLRCVIWDLDRTPYQQEWNSLTTEGGVTGVSFGRVRLGIDGAGSRQTTNQAIAQVIAAAATAGTTVTVDASALPDLVAPVVEGRGKMCGELLRDLLRWHPGATMQTVSGESGDTIVISHRASAATVVFSLGQAPLLGVPRLVKREDLMVDSVHVAYETEATQYVESGDAIRSRNRLVVQTDVWPVASPLTRRSMQVPIPVPADGGSAGTPPLPPQPHTVAIKTRPLPATGSYDAATERFYLNRLGLTAYGLTTDDIALPTTTVGDIKVHTADWEHEADDPENPLYEVPSAINPNSTVLWRPPAVTDLPRYLVSGALAEWMGVKANDLRCTATVGIRKSTVDALSARLKAIFFAKYKPITGEVSGVPAYLLEASIVVRGTNAQSGLYRDWLSVSPNADPVLATGGGVTESLADVVIPNLAQKLYAERSTAPWEGSVVLAQNEAGGTRYLGKVLGLIAADRPEWATMRALIQGETVDLTKGTTTLQVGPPNHLEVADWISLHRAVRRLDEERARMGGSPPIPPAGPGETDPDDDEEADPKGGGIFPGAVEPYFRDDTTGTDRSAKALWDLEVVGVESGSATVKIIRPGTIIKEFADVSVGITITGINDEQTVSAGSRIYLEVTGAEDTPAIALESGSSWTDSPAPVQTSSSSATAAFAAYHYPLWQFLSTSDDATDIKLADGLYARRIGENSHFLRTWLPYQKGSDKMFGTHFLMPYHRKLA